MTLFDLYGSFLSLWLFFILISLSLWLLLYLVGSFNHYGISWCFWLLFIFSALLYIYGSFLGKYSKNILGFFLAFDTKRQLSFSQTELKIEDYGKDIFFTRAGVRNFFNKYWFVGNRQKMKGRASTISCSSRKDRRMKWRPFGLSPKIRDFIWQNICLNGSQASLE